MKKQNQTQEEFERIERYLDGLMDREERAVFENSLKTDKELNLRVEEVSLLRLAVEEQTLRNKLDDFHAEMLLNRPAKTIRPYIKYAVAASVALLIGFAIWLLAGQKSTEEKLFAQYFKPAPGLVTPMSTASDYEFYRGMVDYKQGKYSEAINRWEPLVKEKPENDTLNFYLGLSWLAKGEAGKAIDFLSKAVTIQNSAFIDEAWYYLGMAQLKEGRPEEAVRSFGKSNLENSRVIAGEISGTK